MIPIETENKASAVVALGNFDGLHLGHRHIISQAVRIAQEKDLVPTVWSFSEHPSLFLGKEHPGLLMQAHRRSRLLRAMGVTQEIAAEFNKLRDLSPYDFVEEILQKQLNASHVVCGFNYTFGKCAEGNVALLRKLLSQRGIGLQVADPITFEGEPISSSRIRQLLRNGQLTTANLLLGEPLTMEGRVENGKHLARQWGIPTANVSFPRDFVSLRHGVYATRILIGDRSYPAISNVGLRPTVEDSNKANCESYLFGFEGDLYGANITCEFLQFIRPEQRFDSVEQLKQQIDLDIREVEQYFENKK